MNDTRMIWILLAVLVALRAVETSIQALKVRAIREHGRGGR